MILKKILNILTWAMGVVGLASCSELVGGDLMVEEDFELRDSVDVAFDAAMNAAVRGTRVDYAYDGSKLKLTWGADERLGVFIRKENGRYVRAGFVVSADPAGGADHHFTGRVMSKREGETYVYVHPDLGMYGSMDYTFQNGYTGNAEHSDMEHLDGMIPIVWTEAEGDWQHNPVKKGYAIRVEAKFNEDPGQIRSVTMKTMPMGGRDNIFARSFNYANMEVGGAIDALTLKTKDCRAVKTGDAPEEWTVVAYLASAPLKEGPNVFRSKYNVQVVADNGTYSSEYVSFPGQENLPAGTTSMDSPLQEAGKVYRMERKVSEGPAMTVVNSRYKVNSLLGMWDKFGKPYDPDGLIVYDGVAAAMPAAMPQQLRENKEAICVRYKRKFDDSGVETGTPTFPGPSYGSLYDVSANAYGNVKQGDVKFNNITLTEDTEVFFTFISEFGWNENLIGYYHYPTADEATMTSDKPIKTIVFPNFSKPNHQPFNLGGTGAGSTTTPANIGTPEQAPLREYETVKLLYTDANGYTSTKFPAGTTIGFFMMIDTEAQETTPKGGYDLLKWSQWRLFTNTKWNEENKRSTGSAADWPPRGYDRSNYFVSGDICDMAAATSSTKASAGDIIPGLAMYGVKDKGDNDEATAYGAMIFMVSTSVPTAMQTQNKACFNIGSGRLVVGKE